MKLSKELGFIREYPDPVTFPENKFSEISKVVYETLNGGLYDYLWQSSIFISNKNEVYINNNYISNMDNSCFYNLIEKLLETKNKLIIDNLFLILGRGGVEYIDILDGPYIRTYNNYDYFIRYYSFAFGNCGIKHLEVMRTISEYIEKILVLIPQGINAKLLNKIICLGVKLIEKFNPIQSMKIIQLYYFYGLAEIADHISTKYFKRLGNRFKRFFDANSIHYIKKSVQLMIDLERVRINVSDIYLSKVNNIKEESKNLRIYISKLQKLIVLLKVDM